MLQVIRLPILLLAFGLAGCSSTRVLVKPASDSLPAEVALLPIQTEVDLTREHRGAIQKAILSSLRNRGYLVQKNSRGAVRPPRATVELTVTSFRRDTVLAGHVNTVSGRLRFVDSAGKLLAESEHTETERGGLLFNSGQVFKGLQSEVENLQDDNFGTWVHRFATELARTFPKPKLKGVESLGRSPQIESAMLSTQKNFQRVCAQGSTGHSVRLVFGGRELPLRELSSPGRYCSVLPSYLPVSQLVGAKVELRTAYGLRASKALNFAAPSGGCPNERIIAMREGGSLVFNASCIGPQEPLSCSTVRGCEKIKFRVYQLQETGAYGLLAEFGAEGFRSDLPAQQILSEGSFRTFRMEANDRFQTPVHFQLNTKGSI